MKTLITIILAALISACGGGEATVIGSTDYACRDSAGVDIVCK